MILNVIFLAGGIGIGYLIRGELDRRKSNKAINVALKEGIKVAQKWIDEFSEKKENGNEEISFDDLENIFTEVKDSSNSTDETIRL